MTEPASIDTPLAPGRIALVTIPVGGSLSEALDVRHMSIAGIEMPVAVPADTGVTALSVDTTSTFDRAAGSFLADGFAVGQHITGSGFTNGGNNAAFTVAAVTALVLTVVETGTLTTEIAGVDEQIVADGWTAAGLTFQAGMDGATFNDLHIEDGTEKALVVAGSQYIGLPADFWRSIRSIKIRSGTSGAPVTQLADRIIRVWLRQLF